MTRVFAIPALLALGLSACSPVPYSSPSAATPIEPIYPNPPAGESAGPFTPGDGQVDLGSAPSPQAMAETCRAAAAKRLGRAPNAVSVAPAEETALGFVVFGESPEPLVTVECSFGPEGDLRAVRTA